MNYLSNHTSAIFAAKILEDCAANHGYMDEIRFIILSEICRPDSGRIILDSAEKRVLSYLLIISYEIEDAAKAAYDARNIDYYEYDKRVLSMRSARKLIFKAIGAIKDER